MIVALLLIGWFFSPVLPQVVRTLVPFPKLEGVTYLEGTFDYEGDWPKVKVPRYFVVTETGRQEFHCGYLGGRQACFYKPETFKGKPIKVWTSYWYGRIQHIASLPSDVKPYPFDNAVRSYEESRSAYLRYPYTASQKPNYIGAFLVLCFLCWLIVKEVWRREELHERNKKTI